jgi:Cu-Zn family superoxide dismutase
MKHYLLPGLIFAVAVAVPAFCNQALKANFINIKSESIGYATLIDTKEGVLMHTQLSNLPEGWHGFHIHSIGECIAPNFKSAGGHLNPDNKEHGYENTKGSHLGDLPNVHVGKDGLLETDLLLKGISWESLQDKDGSAIVIHESKDDYTTNPAGNAGARIACGVIGK